MSTTVLPAHRSLAATAQRMAENWLRNVFSPDLYTVRGRDVKAFAPADDHTPDIEVIRAHPKSDADRVPVLVIDIEDADTDYNLAEQSSRVASTGVREYWVLDVIARKLHICRDPRPDADAAHGFSYNQVRVCSPNALVAPQIAELHLAQVVDLLPRE